MIHWVVLCQVHLEHISLLCKGERWASHSPICPYFHSFPSVLRSVLQGVDPTSPTLQNLANWLPVGSGRWETQEWGKGMCPEERSHCSLLLPAMVQPGGCVLTESGSRGCWLFQQHQEFWKQMQTPVAAMSMYLGAGAPPLMSSGSSRLTLSCPSEPPPPFCSFRSYFFFLLLKSVPSFKSPLCDTPNIVFIFLIKTELM